MSIPVSEYMTQVPHSVGHDMGIDKAKELMTKYSCHHLPVLDGGQLVGVISDRDIRTAEKVDRAKELKIEDFMTEEPVVVPPNQDVYQVAMLMHEKKIGSVIISGTENTPWGIFTATDALHFFTQQKGAN